MLWKTAIKQNGSTDKFKQKTVSSSFNVIFQNIKHEFSTKWDFLKLSKRRPCVTIHSRMLITNICKSSELSPKVFEKIKFRIWQPPLAEHYVSNYFIRAKSWDQRQKYIKILPAPILRERRRLGLEYVDHKLIRSFIS